MAISDVSWSPDSRFISIVGNNFKSEMQMWGVDSQLYEKILSIHDAAATNKYLWQQFPINLTEINTN